jgi:Fe-S cluster biogenesis protein NfuA
MKNDVARCSYDSDHGKDCKNEIKRCILVSESKFHYAKENIIMKEQVIEALKKVRPALQRDGGDIELVSVEENGVVKVRLKGACGSCPMSTMTLKMGVEKMLKQEVPAVKEVVQVA